MSRWTLDTYINIFKSCRLSMPKWHLFGWFNHCFGPAGDQSLAFPHRDDLLNCLARKKTMCQYGPNKPSIIISVGPKFYLNGYGKKGFVDAIDNQCVDAKAFHDPYWNAVGFFPHSSGTTRYPSKWLDISVDSKKHHSTWRNNRPKAIICLAINPETIRNHLTEIPSSSFRSKIQSCVQGPAMGKAMLQCHWDWSTGPWRAPQNSLVSFFVSPHIGHVPSIMDNLLADIYIYIYNTMYIYIYIMIIFV